MRGVWCVYEHVFPNGYVYVGKTGMKPEDRWGNGFGYSGQGKVFSLIVKYGWDNIEHKILADNLSEEEATELEEKTIKQRSLIGETANTELVSKKSEISEKNFYEINDDWKDPYIEKFGELPFDTFLRKDERVVEFLLLHYKPGELVNKTIEKRYRIEYPEDIDTVEKLVNWLKQGQPGKWRIIEHVHV